MNRGACLTTIHGVTKSQTRLNVHTLFDPVRPPRDEMSQY